MQLLFLLFAFATFSQAGVVIFARRHPHMSESTRRHLWLTHIWGNGILWSIPILWIIAMQFSLTRTLNVSPLIRLTGISLFVGGVALVIAVSFILNFQELMGLRFFYPTRAKRVSSSLYRFLNNPMYDGFLLMLLGGGLWLGIAEDFYIALASLLLINVFLASIENYELKWNPF